MSKYYNPKRTRNIYSPGSGVPFKISRSKIDLFVECPKCFYLDRRMGIDRPPGFPFALNSAVDALLKKEFDFHRAEGTPHPLMEKYGVDAVPFVDERMNRWRENFEGVQYLHPHTNLIITGAIDDLWRGADGKAIVVDYKSTSKEGEITLDDEWKKGYKRQMEVYQWLVRRNSLDVSDTGYFVYANGKKDREAFDGKLEFDVVLLSYTGSDAWVDETIGRLHGCLEGSEIPQAAEDCDYCRYRDQVFRDESHPAS